MRGRQGSIDDLAGVLDAVPAATVVLDAELAIVAVNRSWRENGARMLPAGAVPSRAGSSYLGSLARLVSPADQLVVLGGLRRLVDTGRAPEPQRIAVNGTRGTVWIQWQAAPLDGGPGLGPAVVVTHTDVTALVHREQQLAWQADHDSLTSLPGRARMHSLVADAVHAQRRTAVLFLDVDGFKTVNDSLGHRIGDRLLTQVAVRLAELTRPGDTVGRLGGDEFLVIARDCDADGALAIAGRLRDAFREPFVVGDTRVLLTVSTGIAVSPTVTGERDPDGVIADADAAMYAAKAAGRDQAVLFTSELRDRARWRLEVSGRLADPATYGELEMYYQPIVRLETGEIEALEALVRWHHPERGLLLPDVFVPVAEETGSVIPMTRWLLGEVCRQAAVWDSEGTPVIVGVNISARHFCSGTLVEDVVIALTSAGLDATRLVLELTETALADDPALVADQLEALHELGVRVAVDDFGTGWSTLARLLSLPLDHVKVDRSLVAAVDGPQPDRAQGVLAAIVALADTLGIHALAEGVETPEQLARVRAAGCVFGQGWLFSRPVPAGEIGSLLVRRRGVPTTGEVPAG